MGIKEQQKHNNPVGDLFKMEEILRPYRSAGTKSHSHKMSIESLYGALIITNKIPPDIAGAVISKTLNDISHGDLDFPGTGEYGSKNRELFNHIRGKCLELINKGAMNQSLAQENYRVSCVLNHCPVRSRAPERPTRFGRVKAWFMLPRVGVLPGTVGITALFVGYVYKTEIVTLIIGLLNGLI